MAARTLSGISRPYGYSILKAACLLAMIATLTNGSAWAAQFVVEDGKATQEVSETSRLYIDGDLVATMVLDEKTPQRRAVITVPDKPSYTYALCGEIVVRNAEGKTETHLVTSQGTLHDPNGHVFQAMGAENFTDFYLIDPSSPTTAEHEPGRKGACTVATS
ncbi:MAG: hypothetical protein ABF876_05010 [Acetobacter aceti]|uniref:Organic solvent tolerance-like N-terminal domain-containing protein n=1 Tax=Acetobacter aceti TaxID=435 RepID=A0A1U9KGN7_ACEAC|nr:hypothetical protein [Acetobacter aceti]AQS84972.1 hypothetical protein A0U92_09495 [Acetobacter aceti]